MPFSGDFMCSSFKRELLVAEHDFTLSTGHQFNMALYDDTSTLTAATTAYTSSGELADTGNYAAKGQALTNVTPTLDATTTAITDFEDEVWSNATFSAMGALIFNEDHASDAAVVVLDFDTLKTATAGDFTVIFPAPAAATAIIRIA
jgi:hypothetical protein